MAGPVTLLAQPHYHRYIDVEGVHEMPWIGDRTVAKGYDLSSKITGSLSIPRAGEPAAFSCFIGFDYPNKGYVAPAMATTYNDNLSTLTVVNGAKASVPFVRDDQSGVDSSWDAFFATSGITSLFMGATYLSAQGSVTRLIASGPNMTATRQTLAGTPEAASVFAVVGNGTSEPRKIQIIRAGSNLGPEFVIPAKTISTIGASDYSGFAAAQAVGVKFVDAASGDRFLLLYLGAGEFSEFLPVPFRNGYASLELDSDSAEWGNGYKPLSAWAGTPMQSIATEGERYWRVPVTRSHFPSEETGCIVSRFLPLGWPVSPAFAPFTVGRIGRSGFDYVLPYQEIGIIGYGNSLIVSSLPEEYDVSTYWNSLNDLDDPFTIRDFAISTNIPIPIPYDAPWDEFLTASFTWTPDTIHTKLEGYEEVSERQWIVGADMPFGGEEAGDDPVYLYGGSIASFWEKSVTWHRDVAVFNRPLTETESAFINDPNSVWSFTMFSTPSSAVISGLTGTHYYGDTVTANFQIRNEDNDVFPLYGSSVWFTMKNQGDTLANDTAAVIEYEAVIDADGTVTGTGINVTDAINGKFSCTFTAPIVPLDWDVQIKDVNGAIKTVASGTFKTIPDVTKDTV